MVQETRVATSFKSVHALEPILSAGPVLTGTFGEHEDVIVTRYNGHVTLRSRITGMPQKRFTIIEDDESSVVVQALALSKTHLFTIINGGMVESRELISGELARSWKAHSSPVLCMEHHKTAALLATGSADHTVRVWNSAQGFCTHSLKGIHGGVVNALCFYPSADRLELFSAAEDGSIAHWDLSAGGKGRAFKSHVSAVRSLDVSSDGRFLLSGGRDQVITVWDVEKAKVLRTIPALESVEAVLFLADGEHYITGGDKGILRKWSLKSATCVATGPKLTTGEHGFAFLRMSCTGDLVVTTTDLQIISVSVDTLASTVKLPGQLGEVTDVAYLPDGALAVTTNDSDLRLFPSPLDSLSCQILSGHQAAILCVASTGSWLVTGSRDHGARLWHCRAGGEAICTAILAGHTDAVGAVAITMPKGRETPFIATASADMTVKLWEVDAKGQASSRWTVKAHDKDINSLTFAPNGRSLISGSQDKTAKVWRFDDGSLLGILKGHKRGVWAVRCSPVEQVIVTASADQTVRLWSASSFECLRTLEGHTASVLRVAFLRPDASELISAGADGLVKIWDLRTGECARTLDEHQDRIWSLALHGQQLATADASGFIRLWTDCTQEEANELTATRQALLMMEQDLSNMLIRRDFKNAVVLAIELDQPFRIFGLLNELTKGLSAAEARERLHVLLSSLPGEKLDRLLGYIKDWNASFKRATLAQLVLHVLLRLRKTVELSSLVECCKALLPYSERHFEHLQELSASAHLTGFLLHHMDNYTL